MLKKLYSVKRYDDGLVLNKCVTVLGVPFRFSRPIKSIKNISDNITGNMYRQNNNLVNLLFAMSSENNLLYIRTSSSLFIFTKRIFESDTEFFYNFLTQHACHNMPFSFNVMPKTCELYHEHINAFQNENVLCVKYLSRMGGILARTTISFGDDLNDLYISVKHMGTENYVPENGLRYVDVPRRKFIRGISVWDYVRNMPTDEQKKTMKRFFDHVFETFPSKTDTNKLDGCICDGHMRNFLISDGKFIFFDRDVVGDDIDKDIYVWYVCHSGQHPLYPYFCELYGLKRIPNNFVYPIWRPNNNMARAVTLNRELMERYFSDKRLVPTGK